MKFTVHMSPPSLKQILSERKRTSNSRIGMSVALFSGVAIYSAINYIRFDYAILASTALWGIFVGVCYLMGLLEPRNLQFVSGDVNKELIEMSLRHEVILNYVRGANNRTLVRGELAELRRYNKNVHADSDSSSEDNDSDDVEDVLERVKINTGSSAS